MLEGESKNALSLVVNIIKFFEYCFLMQNGTIYIFHIGLVQKG